MPLSLVQRIEARALSLGFSRVGIVPAGELAHGEHLERWLAEGFHGEMRWMEKHRALRTNPAVLEPGTRTVIVLAAPYFDTAGEGGTTGAPALAAGAASASGASGDAGAARARGAACADPGALFSRYAQGDDYHDVLRDRMRTLARYIEEETGRPVRERPAVDSAPLLERNLAVDAGIGWLGKSAMVLHQGQGSWFFLAELLIDLELESLGRPQPDRCGTCTRCIDLCPTGAIVAPYRVDARRCISYLTIELRGPIPRELRPLIGGHIFGCDICQSVCPWNDKATLAAMAEFRPRPEVAALDAAAVLRMDQATFSATFRNSAVKRTKRRGLARNAAVVLGNTGDPGWAGELAAALRGHDEPLVRGHAAWALGRVGGPRAHTLLALSLSAEEDPWVREEIALAQESRP